MKRIAWLVFLMIALSAFSGYLLSRASLVGKIGISMFYEEYRFLKIWWQGALVVFTALSIILLIHELAHRKLSYQQAMMVHIIMAVFALAGILFTFYDFTHTTTHKILGPKFHVGAYLFWSGWILISLFYLLKKNPQIIEL